MKSKKCAYLAHEVFAPGIAIQDAGAGSAFSIACVSDGTHLPVLPALLVVQHHVHRDLGPAGPFGIWRSALVAFEIAVAGGQGDVLCYALLDIDGHCGGRVCLNVGVVNDVLSNGLQEFRIMGGGGVRGQEGGVMERGAFVVALL